MATPVYVFYLPTVGGSTDTWGTDLNSNWAKLDGILSGTEGNPIVKVEGAQILNADIDATDIGSDVKRQAYFTTLECNSFASNNETVLFTSTLGETTANEFIGLGLGNATGNAATADSLETSRDFSITGPISSGAVSFDGRADCSLPVVIDYDLLWPVGSVYMTTENTIPDNLFAGTTWEKTSGGQVPVGVGTHIDLNGEAKTFSIGDEDGVYFQLLLADQTPLPDHQHLLVDASSSIYSDEVPSANGVMAHYRNYSGDQAYNLRRTSRGTGSSFATAGLTGSVLRAQGTINPHANTMPYLTVNQWKRIS
jgi:microcystin-dependent protein